MNNKIKKEDKPIENRLKRVVIDPEFLFRLLYSNRKVFIYNELPEGCVLKGCYYEFREDKIYLIISNPKFEEVDEGAIIPIFEGEVLVKELPEEKK